MKQVVLAIVDPIISPIYLTQRLKDLNYKIIAVFSLTNLSEEEKKIRFHPELFDDAFFVTTESVVEIAEKLKALETDYVFYGYEGSVAFADQLAHLVCPSFANSPSTSMLRCDKYYMQEAIRALGLPGIKQMKIHHKQLTFQQQAELEKWDFPVVVKPLHGAATIDVKVCNTSAEVTAFLASPHDNQLDASIADDYVVQEKLEGIEYLIDSVSLAGEHHLVAIQRYHKVLFQSVPIYRYTEIVAPDEEEYEIISAYVLKVLSACNFNHGFSHIELFMTDTGPRLIEINPRISGTAGFINKLSELTLNYSQPQALDELIHHLPQVDHPLQAYGRVVLLQNWCPRCIATMNLPALQALPSYRDHLMLKPPKTMNSPKNLTDTVALVLLVNASMIQLEKDYSCLLELEATEQLF